MSMATTNGPRDNQQPPDWRREEQKDWPRRDRDIGKSDRPQTDERNPGINPPEPWPEDSDE
jgi:hypothetical protein